MFGCTNVRIHLLSEHIRILLANLNMSIFLTETYLKVCKHSYTCYVSFQNHHHAYLAQHLANYSKGKSQTGK